MSLIRRKRYKPRERRRLDISIVSSVSQIGETVKSKAGVRPVSQISILKKLTITGTCPSAQATVFLKQTGLEIKGEAKINKGKVKIEEGQSQVAKEIALVKSRLPPDHPSFEC